MVFDTTSSAINPPLFFHSLCSHSVKGAEERKTEREVPGLFSFFSPNFTHSGHMARK